uniref:Uncharacterized protein n=1 Tax=Brassica campestris TaxID=3711 RepID=A0A3P6AU66_BRACM|nr:unnamed protein product [Brassica rapa]
MPSSTFLAHMLGAEYSNSAYGKSTAKQCLLQSGLRVSLQRNQLYLLFRSGLTSMESLCNSSTEML